MVTIKNIAIIAALGLVIANSARAQTTTYDYSGQVMSGGGSLNTTLDGTVTLATPLAPNLSNVPVIPTYALFDVDAPDAGGFQIGPGPSYAGLGLGAYANVYTTLQFTTLDFSTNSTGAITGWDLTMAGTTLSGESFTATSTQSGDSARLSFLEGNDNIEYFYSDFANSSGGSWSGPMTAPEIDARSATAALTLLAGLIIVITDRRRPSLPVRSGAAAQQPR